VSRVSQTPLYDQLRGERLNADGAVRHGDIPVGEAQQEPLGPGGLRLVGDGGSAAGGAREVSGDPKLISVRNPSVLADTIGVTRCLACTVREAVRATR
jgi:hypothetical protein